MPRVPFALLAVWFVLPALAAQEVSEPADLSRRIDAMFHRCDKPGVPGAVALLARGAQVLHRAAYGLADLERNVSLLPDSVLDIGSVSKQFTAACVLLLVQDGAVALDDPVRKHVTEMPECMQPVTVRHMLLHVSGIPDYIGLLMKKGVDVEDRVTPQEGLDVLVEVERLTFETGSKWAYSNSNYFLLAEIVERRAPVPLPEFARQRIFTPLGMKATHYRADTHVLVPNRALSFSPVARGRWVANYSNWEQLGDGAVYTTVDDLWRWARNFESFEVGGEALQAAWSGPGKLDDGELLDYGFGLQFQQWRGRDTVHHSGAWQGFRADFLLVPSERIVAICLCNRTDLAPNQLTRGMARLAIDG